MSTKCVTQSSLLSGLGWVYPRRDPATDLKDGKRERSEYLLPSLPPCLATVLAIGVILCGHTGPATWPLCHSPNPHWTMVTLPPPLAYSGRGELIASHSYQPWLRCIPLLVSITLPNSVN